MVLHCEEIIKREEGVGGSRDFQFVKFTYWTDAIQK